MFLLAAVRFGDEDDYELKIDEIFLSIYLVTNNLA
jgi:hypothetical protein